MSPFLYRLGRGSARHRRLVVAGWLFVVIALALVGKAAGGQFHDTFSIPGVESQKAVDLLQRTFPTQAGGSAQVVFHSKNGKLTDPANASAITQTLAKMHELPNVEGVASPLETKTISKDGTIGLGTVSYNASGFSLPPTTFDQLQQAASPAEKAGLQVEFGGEIPQAGDQPTTGSSEALGILAAMVILLLAFGSVIAMGLPIATAIFGLGAGITTITFISAFVDMPSTTTAIASMVGLGVGIDYALFIITRHRVGLHKGLTVEDAAGRAIATAGQAVLIAGVTVVIAILGLAVAEISMVTFMGIGAAIVVSVMVIAALTLLPALIGFAGHNIDRYGIPGTQPKAEAGTMDANGHYHGWARWAHHVTRHPVPYLIGSLLLVLTLAQPATHMRLGLTDASQDPTSSTLRRSYDLLAKGFGPGFNGPLLVAVDLSSPGAKDALPKLAAAMGQDADVVSVAPPQLSPTGESAILTVTPKSAPQDAETTNLVNRLRQDVIPPAIAATGAHAYIGGQTATFIDLSNRVADRLFLFIGSVVGLSFLLLMLVFRSILVPLKAAAMNILSIAAAYGVIVAVFQNGWGASLFGVHQSLPIVSFIPMFMFAILFGLSMDYEVFLLSRIREEYLVDSNNTESIISGITTTARVITSAALIMISVFLSFVLGDNAMIKMMGLGLAVAVFVDATIIRMVLVPAVMQLIGDANWWLPRWLDRILPNLDIEGETRLPPEEYEVLPAQDEVDEAVPAPA